MPNKIKYVHKIYQITAANWTMLPLKKISKLAAEMA